MEIRNVTIPDERPKAYLVNQRQRADTVEMWVPKSVVTYKRTHPREQEKEQEYNLTIEDWWLDKNEAPFQ